LNGSDFEDFESFEDFEGFEDTQESFAILESMAEDGYESISVGEMLEDFVERTSMLSEAERANILAAAMAENAENRTAQGFQIGSQVLSGITDFAATLTAALAPNNPQARQAVQALRGVQAGAQLAGQISGAFNRPQQQPQPQPQGRPQQGQVPPLPSSQGATQPSVTPSVTPPSTGGAAPPPSTGGTAPSTPASTGGSSNAAAVLAQLFGSGGLLQSLSGAIVGGSTARQEAVVELDGPEGTSQVAIPMGAVMNAIAHLATEAMLEFNASTHESAPAVPDYLMSESGEFIVDPSDSAARAALVVEYFRRAQATQQNRTNGFTPGSGLNDPSSGDWTDFDF
jgi:hypothetical protein